MIDALEKRILDKLKQRIDERLKAEMKKFQDRITADVQKLSNSQKSKAIIEKTTTQVKPKQTSDEGDGGFSLYVSLSNDIFLKVQDEFKSFERNVSEKTEARVNILQRHLDTQIRKVQDEFRSFERNVSDNTEARVNSLLRQLDSQAHEQLASLNMSITNTFEEKVNNLQSKLDQMKSQRPASSPARTCRELMDSDSGLESGFHYIDPDGLGLGDPPIRVRCEKSGNLFICFF